ncbi:HNH endonuclease [Sphaerotilus microaerophilus]|uniref:HNH domain-containing protein n=1 Tax=Sphaerotilus microaerophilus TaxID=2914710 RepID=A0ABN6PL48_9BURK|nr:HNH endonuclease [Sphaerotilus sp. FB-5]BDI04272.1 hypothetical protein CATMQ487_12420 [Sphaerotilus sp. FB-5]
MRPVRRGPSPQTEDYSPYTAALAPLVARMGLYCSYCERPIPTNLAVEHIQPKALAPYAGLIGRWTNYLLGCVNCNSTKGDRDAVLAELLLPDRDNTAAAFLYTADGRVQVAPKLTAARTRKAQALLALVGLDKAATASSSSNEAQVALDRVSQRMQAWLEASEARAELRAQPQLEPLRRMIVKLAQARGFFSVWMTVFADDADMRARLVKAFPGTAESGCFDSQGALVRPAPNPDQLKSGRKI